MRCFYFVLVATVLSSPSAQAAFECFVEMPVYDQFGTRLAFKLESVRPFGAKPPADNDRRFASTYRIAGEGQRIEFDRMWLRTDGLVAKMAGPGKKAIEVKVPLGMCRYRQSTVYGNNDSGADVNYSTAVGQISGCKLVGDWWVRAVPMFGGGAYVGSFEGFVDRTTGQYSIAASFTGQRHLIVLGRGKEAIRTVSTDLVIGSKNRLPTIFLTTDCT